MFSNERDTNNTKRKKNIGNIIPVKPLFKNIHETICKFYFVTLTLTPESIEGLTPDHSASKVMQGMVSPR